MLFRFDTGAAAFPDDLRERAGRRGACSVISDKDDYVLAWRAMCCGSVRPNPIEGVTSCMEIDAHPGGVFALLKDCNQDIVWIGTDGSGLLRQGGEVAIRSVTYETLPYLLTKPDQGALHVDPDGDLWIGTKNDGILRIRDLPGVTSWRIPTAIRPPIRR